MPNCNENLVNLFSGGTGDTYSTWGGQADNGSENTVYAFNDDFTWIKGNHTFKFGGMFKSTTTTGSAASAKPAAWDSVTRKPAFRAGPIPNAGGNAFASFLLGYADSGQIDTPRFIGQQFYYFGGFAQDDWRVSRKLVVNFGVRWDGNLPPTGLDNRWC